MSLQQVRTVAEVFTGLSLILITSVIIYIQLLFIYYFPKGEADYRQWVLFV